MWYSGFSWYLCKNEEQAIGTLNFLTVRSFFKFRHGKFLFFLFFRKLFQSTRLYIKGMLRRLASKCAWQIVVKT